MRISRVDVSKTISMSFSRSLDLFLVPKILEHTIFGLKLCIMVPRHGDLGLSISANTTAPNYLLFLVIY